MSKAKTWKKVLGCFTFCSKNIYPSQKAKKILQTFSKESIKCQQQKYIHNLKIQKNAGFKCSRQKNHVP